MTCERRVGLREAAVECSKVGETHVREVGERTVGEVQGRGEGKEAG